MIGKKLETILKRRGITHRYLSAQTDIPYWRLQQIIKDRYEVKPSELKKICSYLKISSSVLLGF